MNFLASGRTYSMYDRERINCTHVTKDVAEQNTLENLDKKKSRKLKPKVNHGKLKNMNSTRMLFSISEIKLYSAEKPVNWTKLVGKYNITN